MSRRHEQKADAVQALVDRDAEREVLGACMVQPKDFDAVCDEVSLEAGDASRLDAIAFRAAGQPLGELLLNTGGLPVHVAGTLKRDTWGGREKIELTIDDAADPRKQ